MRRDETVLSTHTSSPKVDLNKIMRYENWRVVKRIQKDFGLSSAAAEELFTDTKKFLYVCATNPATRLGPTSKIDDGWHTFLLFTRDYADFCKEHFGRFMHHQPHVENEHGPNVVPPKMKTAVDLAKKIFGDDLSKNWDCSGMELAEGQCSGSTNCGGDDAGCW